VSAVRRADLKQQIDTAARELLGLLKARVEAICQEHNLTGVYSDDFSGGVADPAVAAELRDLMSDIWRYRSAPFMPEYSVRHGWE